MEEIINLNYPKLFIFNESENTKILNTNNSMPNELLAKEYNWKIISSITEKNQDNENFTLIQNKDKKLGWVKLDSSIQIFRFEPRTYRIINDDFTINDINMKMLINKNFKDDLPNKLLTVRSEIEYQGERLLSIFIKDEFYGFHDAKYFEELIESEITIPQDLLYSRNLYKSSDLKKAVNIEVELNKPKIISFFKLNKVGKIKINKDDYYWISLDGLDKYLPNTNYGDNNKDYLQKYVDDIIYALNRERRQSKEIVKTVLTANNYIKSKIEREKNKLKKELELSEKRLNHQKDYNERLERQKEKYKSRMNLLEKRNKK